MTKETAPTKQFLVTKDNILEVVNKIYVKKSSLPNPNIIERLKGLCEINKDNNPIVQLAIFEARKEVLESACEIYIEHEQDLLFEEANDELNLIVQMLAEHTITQ